MASRNRAQLKSFIRFQLSQLSARNAHHEFESLAFEVARVRVVPNLVPATGPVQSGGDQGRDFESYRTYLAQSPMGNSAFATKAGADVVVGACSIQKNITNKIKTDLGSIFGAGTRPDHVAYFCEADIPVARRHELQEFCRATYGATLDIFDGQALADILAERDTFWIAEQFLSIPADQWPAESTSEQYNALRERWITRGEEPQNYAEFLEVKQGLRAATFDETAKPDLSSWLRLMHDFVSEGFSDRLTQKARYEIAVAELRGRGSLDPALIYVEDFFENISIDSSSSELVDAAVLVVYAWGAVGLNQTSISPERIEHWKEKIQNIFETALSKSGRVIDRCTLLEARATLAPISFKDRPISADAANLFFDLWYDVVRQIQKTPFYPVDRVARILELATPLLGTHPRFRQIVDEVDLLVAERAGASAAADLARNRATAHLKANRHLAAINELQKAKVGWFSGETMGGSILSMLLIGRCLSDLRLHFAARYYAAGALFLALNHNEEDLEGRLGDAYFLAADTFFAAGEGISYVYVLADALNVHHSVASDPHDWNKHKHVASSFAQALALRAVARRIDPTTVPLIDKGISAWPLPEEEQKNFIELSDGPPWASMTREEVEKKLAEELGQHPFSDIGRRRAVWSALGIEWTVRGEPTQECWLAVLEIAAVLQLAHVEFGDADLVVVPSDVTIEVSLHTANRIQMEQMPDNGKLTWRVMMPAEYANEKHNDHAFELTGIAITILGQATALPFDEFMRLTEERLKRGLSNRFFSVRPIRELMAFVQPDALPFLALSNSTRRELISRISPIGSHELEWPSSSGPGYSRERAEEFLQNRYSISKQSIALTLPRLLRDDRCKKIIQELRKEGLLDWQILGVVSSIVIQYQIQKMFPDRDIRALEKEMRSRIYRTERSDDPEFDLAAFSAEIVTMQKKIITAAALKTWGLEIHRQTPDFIAIKKLLDIRYKHSIDDLPHEDPFL